jgi:hypothetical protein
MNNSVIGLDIAKNIFHLFTLLADGKILKKKLKRHELLAYFANYPASTIGIEACGSSHHPKIRSWAFQTSLVLSPVEGIAGIGMFTKWVVAWKTFMLRRGSARTVSTHSN